MSSWTELLAQAESGDHVVQLYGEDDQLLARNASRYLAEGISRLDGLVVITTPEQTQAIARHLAEEGASTTLDEDVDKAGLNSIVGAHTHLFAGPRTILSSGRGSG